MKKRLLSAFMALALCLTLLPVPVWAEGDAPEDGTPMENAEPGGDENTEPDMDDEDSPDADPEDGDVSTQSVDANADSVENAVAEVNGVQYASLSEALEQVEDGGTVTMLDNITKNKIDFFLDAQGDPADKTVTLVMNEKGLGYSEGVPLNIKSGKLIISDIAAISQLDLSSGCEAVSVSGGTLEFKNMVDLSGGISFSGDGKLEGGFKEYSRLLAGGSHSVSVKGSNTYTTVLELLAEGCAFAAYDRSDFNNGGIGDILPANVSSLTQDVTVVKCTHKNGDVSLFEDGVCTACGFTCAHETVENNTCTNCHAQMAAKDDSDKYYADLEEAFDGVGNTGTVTLLADVTESVEFNKYSDTKVTLKMNGHSLTSADGGPALTVKSGTLKFGDPAKINGGLCVTEGVLDGGLPLDSIFTKGSNSYSICWDKAMADVFDLRAAKNHAFASYDSSTGTKGDIIVIGTKGFTDPYGSQIQMDVQIVQCDHSIGFRSDSWGVHCNGCNSPCPHERVDGENKCTECQQAMVAKGSNGSNGSNDNYYSLADDAFLNAADDSTVTLLADAVIYKGLFTNADGSLADKSVTLIMNGKKLYKDTNDSALSISSGRLTISDEAAISTSKRDIASDPVPAVWVGGGTLEFQKKATINGGLKVTDCDYGNGTGTVGKLEGGLKEGTVILANGTVNMCYSVSVEGSGFYSSVRELLPDGYAFAKYNSDGTTGDIVDGSGTKLNGNVIVVEHTHSFGADGKCACGYSCPGHEFENGVCTLCGYVCPHGKVTEAADGKSAVCDDCNAPMAVKVTNGSTDTYYAQSFDFYGDDDDTLNALLNDDTITPSGCTVTLLADDLQAWAVVEKGKSITLDLNGKNLVETVNSGICVYSNSTLTVTGEGSSTPPDNLSGQLSSYVFKVLGGELVFDNHFCVKDGGKLNGICVGSGTLTSTREDLDVIKIGTLKIDDADATISFKAAAFDKIVFDSSSGRVKLGDLLEKNSGRAFQHTTDDKAFLPYNTEITKDKPIENVEIAICPHDNITGNTCDYCGMEHIVAICTNDSGSYSTYLADNTEPDTIKARANAAFKDWNDRGGTLKLFVDFELEDITLTNSNATVLDLNGHTITGGTLTQTGSGKLTITDSSADKAGSFANVTVNGGASLIVDGATVGTIKANEQGARVTLNAGSWLGVIDLSGSGLKLFDCLGEGCCFVGDISVTAAIVNGVIIRQIQGTLTPPVNKDVTISYGGSVSSHYFPQVMPNGDGSILSLSYEWLYRDSNGDYISPSNAPVTGEGQSFDMICVIKAWDKNGNTLWATPVTGYKLTVTKANLADATVTVNNADSLIFTPDGNGVGQTQTLDFTVTYNGNPLTRGTDYTITSGDSNCNAGEHTLTLQGKGNYTGKLEHKWTVKPRMLGGTSKLTKTYDGTTALPKTITFSDWNAEIDITLTEGTDYAVTGQYDSAAAGKRTADLTVKLTNNNYTFRDGMTATINAKNSASISKAPAPQVTERGSITIYYDRSGAAYTFDLNDLLPALDGGKRYGELKSAPVSSTLPSDYSFSCNLDQSLKLNLNVSEAPSSGEDKKLGTFTFTLKFENYEDIVLYVDVNVRNRLTPTGAPTLSTTEITYGDAVSSISLSGALKYDGKDVTGKFEWTEPDATPDATLNDNLYEVEWKFVPDNTIYAEATGTVTITVNQATPTGAPKYTAITGSGKTLADAALTVNNGWPAGTVKWVDANGAELSSDTEVTANTAYKWVFTPNSANYKPIDGTITLWRRSSSGGGSSSSGTTKTETTTNPDGSVTKTEIKSDGTVTETTTRKDGSTTKTETKPDGSSKTEVKEANGSTGTVRTDKDGNTNAEAKVSDKAVSDAKKADEAVKIPTEVTPGEDSKSAPTVKIDLPKNSGETKIEIPVKDVTPGTVAVIVKPDGTEEIVKDSVPTKDGIQLIVDGDVTVKIVDNAKDFTDTRGHWAQASIDFVSARGLMSGKSATTFAPNAPTTRAQLWTILARQAGADLTGGASWYEKAQNWAKANGISDGSSPNSTITRAQMVAMLYRAAGSPEVSGTAFTDVSADSYYAKAVAWAVQHGITTGVGGGKFDPNGICTRAQIAVFLHRSYLSK